MHLDLIAKGYLVNEGNEPKILPETNVNKIGSRQNAIGGNSKSCNTLTGTATIRN
jgi:hypothetical protein